jgi:peptide/nickel transport system permease protein
MIPILTGVVVSIPFLFIGSLVLESFFAILGMGSFMLEAIQRQDFAIVQAMVLLGAVMYVVGLILTDISYTFVDPRIKFS